jgi:predicted metal-binding membrane protein
MAAELGHAHPHEAERLPRIAWGVLAATALVVLAAWVVTLRTAQDYDQLMAAQLAGVAPVSTVLFLALSAVMMVAMMLPSGLPMFAAYRAIAAKDEAGQAGLRTFLFGSGYFAVWALFTAGSLVALMALGLMDELSGPVRFVPALLLVGAGVYQLTGWKQFCLRHCRSPIGFLATHWRKGARGALRMGLEHSAYCLGCCWLLMLVLFVAGSMSVLWMGVFAGFILAEKVGGPGERVARWLGVAGILVGLYALGFAWTHPVLPAVPGMGGMAMGA